MAGSSGGRDDRLVRASPDTQVVQSTPDKFTQFMRDVLSLFSQEAGGGGASGASDAPRRAYQDINSRLNPMTLGPSLLDFAFNLVGGTPSNVGSPTTDYGEVLERYKVDPKLAADLGMLLGLVEPVPGVAMLPGVPIRFQQELSRVVPEVLRDSRGLPIPVGHGVGTTGTHISVPETNRAWEGHEDAGFFLSSDVDTIEFYADRYRPKDVPAPADPSIQGFVAMPANPAISGASYRAAGLPLPDPQLPPWFSSYAELASDLHDWLRENPALDTASNRKFVSDMVNKMEQGDATLGDIVHHVAALDRDMPLEEVATRVGMGGHIDIPGYFGGNSPEVAITSPREVASLALQDSTVGLATMGSHLMDEGASLEEIREWLRGPRAGAEESGELLREYLQNLGYDPFQELDWGGATGVMNKYMNPAGGRVERDFTPNPLSEDAINAIIDKIREMRGL